MTDTPTSNIHQPSPLNRALVAVKDMREKLRKAEEKQREPIAVVGMSCRFPGPAGSISGFWEVLRNGRDAVSAVPESRWDINKYFDPNPDVAGKMYMRSGGFLASVDRFDARFFNITPREAARMDPQQRLLLEVAWEALENAGIAPDTLKDSRTGTFIGISTSEYLQLGIKQDSSEGIDAYTGTGGALSVAAGRLSYFLKLRGPAVSLDTACSSSLVALDLAVMNLRSGKCDLALAGGVNLMLSPDSAIFLCKIKALSGDGRCKSFDASADGYGRGEGCGIIALKRLSDAQAQNDRILAVIRGTATNHDGHSSGLTVPNGTAQKQVIQSALSDAGLEPGQVHYIEAHGTGTALGDPIELRALNAVFGNNRKLLVGTAKTNIGHLEAAAGIAGVIKVILAFHHGVIPQNLHFTAPNPHIPWDDYQIAIPTKPTPWPEGIDRPVAGVSSFGFSGTNAHVILEAPPAADRMPAEIERPAQVLPLSAQSEKALKELAQRYADHLAGVSPEVFGDICHTAGAGRNHFGYRLAVTGDSPERMIDGLRAYTDGRVLKTVFSAKPTEPNPIPKVAFLFTGQGSQYAGMGKMLYETQPTFRRYLDRCHEVLGSLMDVPLLPVLFPSEGKEAESTSTLNQTAVTQPALFSIEYALSKLWQSWGVMPSAVMGHSVGEYVAACIAGVFTLEDGLKLISARGRLMQTLPKNGSMAAVFADRDTVLSIIAPYENTVSVAAHNGPSNTVIAGLRSDVTAVVEQLKNSGIHAQFLNVSHAFHSPLMEPMMEAFGEVVSEVSFSIPRVKLISNITGRPVEAASVNTADWWVRHIRNAVEFSESMNFLAQEGFRTFLEIGPHPVLNGMARSFIDAQDCQWLASLSRNANDWEQILESFSRLYVAGAPINWMGFDNGYSRGNVSLPTYPFQRSRFWLPEEGHRSDGTTPERDAAGTKAKTAPVPNPEKMQDDWLFQVKWELQKRSLPQENRSHERIQTCLIFSDELGFGEALSEKLGESGINCIRVDRGKTFSKHSDRSYSIDPDHFDDYTQLLHSVDQTTGHAPIGCIHLWSLDHTGSEPVSAVSLEACHRLLCGSILYLTQALSSNDRKNSQRIWMITRGAQAIEETGVEAVFQSPLWGLGRVLINEMGDMIGGLIDLDPNVLDKDLGFLADYILEEDREKQVAYRNGSRFVGRLAPVPEIIKDFPKTKIQSDGTYLLTGGTGGLGLEVAKWMADKGAGHVVIVGRNKPPQRTLSVFEAIEQKGVRVHFYQADVTLENEIQGVLKKIEATLPPVKGVVHLAGVLDDGLVSGQTWERFSRVMAPKVAGGWALHHATRSLPLDFFVLFSSAGAVLGSAGQSNYAAANAFLDALAAFRRSQNLPGLSIAWGPWAEVGMAANTDDQAQRRLKSLGIGMIPVKEGMDALDVLVGANPVQVCVINADWQTYTTNYPIGRNSGLFSAILQTKESVSDAPEALKPEKPKATFSALEEAMQKPFLEEYLKTAIGKIIGLPGSEISAGENFMALGLDSLMVMELINLIKRDFTLTLYAREVFEEPSVNRLTELVHKELRKQPDGHSITGVSHTESSSVPAIGRLQSRPPAKCVGEPNPPMVFLLSSPRSGSTLLRVMMAGHPDLFCPPELHLLQFEGMGQRESAFGESYMTEGLQRAMLEVDAADTQAQRDLLEEWIQRDSATTEVYRWLQGKVAPRLLVDKSPTYAMDPMTLAAAEELFHRPKYIHLVRHPFSVIESFVRNRMQRLAGINTEDPSLLAEQVWCETNANVIDFFETVDKDRQLLIYYEHLVNDPAGTMEKLCRFLGISFSEALLHPYEGKRMTEGVHQESLGIGDPNFLDHSGIDASLSNAWKNVSLKRSPGGFLKRVARELDYELPTASIEAQEENAGRAMQPASPVLEPIPRNRPVPLSFQQERLWFLMELEPENRAYNMPGLTFRMKGKLNEDALKQALEEMIRRHEILRTVFTTVEDKPVQVINPHVDLSFRVEDISTDPEHDGEAKAFEIVSEALGERFDIKNGPLMKAVVIRLSSDDHLLVFPVHHLVFDGWSFGVFLQELSSFYNAICKNEKPNLQPLPLQYADFSHWQRKWLDGPALEHLVEFWKGRLGTDIPTLQLPVDRPRPSVQTYNGAKTFFKIPSELAESLKQLGKSNDATLFMTLLAVFKTLLFRYSGQTDFAIGSPTANRNRNELEGLIGFFVNNLVLRTDLSGDPEFIELLHRVRNITLDAYDHQDLPFEKLVEELRPARDLSYSPLFQVMFVLQNVPVKSDRFSGLTFHQVHVDTKTSMFDLTLTAWEENGELNGKFEYNSDLFDPETIERMVGHFKTLASNVVSDPHVRLSRLNLLPEKERHRLLVEWNDTVTDYPTNKTLSDLFEEQVSRTPDAVALDFDGHQLTYAQLNGRANQLAHYLKSKGVGPEVLVGLFMDRSIEMVVGIYGVIKAGGAYVPIDPEYPGERIDYIIGDTDVPVILTQEHLAGQLTADRERVCLDSDWHTVSQSPEENPARTTTTENLAYVIYTSGSTGRPKGVMNEHGGIVNRLIWMQEEYQLTPEDRVLQKTPYSFDVSVWEFFWPLLFGARLVIAHPGGHRDSTYLINCIKDNRITTLHFVPSMLQLFLETPGVEQCTGIKRVICSGEALSHDLQEAFFKRLNAALHNLYGPTEAAVDVTYWACRPDSQRNTVPIGFPVANTSIYILDEHLKPVPTGCTGELHIGGIQVARGYLNRPELTAEKFIPDPFAADKGARLYKTGDLARYLPDGSIDYLGRIDFQVKIRGLRVELGEIEAQMVDFKEVRKCVVVLREDDPGDQRLVAYYVPEPGADVEMPDFRDRLKKHLPEYMVPSTFMALKALPLLTNGKVNRKALPVPENTRRQSENAYIAPRSDMEQIITDVWSSALKMDKVGVDDNFFDLGGHSLLMAQVNNKLQHLLKKEIAMVTLFKYPTISALAKHLSGSKENQPSFRDVHEKARKQKAGITRRKELARRKKSR